MKKFITLLLVFVACFIFSSCESEPMVTSMEEIVNDEPEYGTDYWGNVMFRGTRKVRNGWLHWDENKECPYQNGYTFRVVKNTPSKILKSDRCAHCGYTWDIHDDV